MPLVSVITKVTNIRAFSRRLLRTFEHEILATLSDLNDASNDVSRQIMDSHATKDLPIRVIFPDYDKGFSKTETEQLRESF